MRILFILLIVIERVALIPFVGVDPSVIHEVMQYPHSRDQLLKRIIVLVFLSITTLGIYDLCTSDITSMIFWTSIF